MQSKIVKRVLSKNIGLLKKEYNNDLFINNVLLPVYGWIESAQVKSGAIKDNFVHSELKFQYHVANFVLSSVILFKLSNEKQYYNNALKSIKYLSQIVDATKNSSSFNALPLLLSLLIVGETELKSSIINFIKKLDFYPSLNTTHRRSNNLYIFKGLSHILRANLIQSELSNKDQSIGKDIIVNYLLNWQFSDGFFYDAPFERNNENGIPHTTYHATMWMLLTISALFLKDENLIERSKRAFEVIESVTSPSGELSYGRSNNTIFGYTSAILACSMHSILEPKDKLHLMGYRQRLLNVMLKNQAEDGHFYIVPNSIENTRCGFDNYMFVSVYNSFALSLLLLSHLIIPFSINNEIY